MALTRTLLTCPRCGALHWVQPWLMSCRALHQTLRSPTVDTECGHLLTASPDDTAFQAMYQVGGVQAIIEAMRGPGRVMVDLSGTGDWGMIIAYVVRLWRE